MSFQNQYNSYGFLPLIPYYSSKTSQSYYDDGSSSSSGSPSLGLVTPPEGPLPHFMRPSQTEENYDYYSPFPSTEPGDFQYFAPSGTGSAVHAYDFVPALDFMHDKGEAGAIFTPLTNLAYPPASPYCSNSLANKEGFITYYGNPHQADGVGSIRHTYPQNVVEERYFGESGARQPDAFSETGSATYNVDPLLDFAQEKQEAGLAIVRPVGRKSMRKSSLFECGLTSTTAPHPPAAPQYAYTNYDGVNEPTVYEDPYALAGSDAHRSITSTGM
ncbi:hypothetical protein BJ912DRAFT_971261 [Pholiota molesta]|nr:hypothetical protein BJ912DRAFT_971261 [Pholiota molesta]